MSKSKGKKAKLPKRIAGIKVPKALRKSNISLTSLLETRAGREAVAGVLVAVAGALAGNEKVREALAEGGHDFAQSGRAAGHAGSDLVGTAVRGVAEVATGAVVEAARHVLPGGRGADGGKRQSARAADRSTESRQGNNSANDGGNTAQSASNLPAAAREG